METARKKATALKGVASSGCRNVSARDHCRSVLGPDRRPTRRAICLPASEARLRALKN